MDIKLIVLRAASDAQVNVLPAFGGLTLKDVGEIARLTMTRDESLTARGVAETRRGYNNLRGISQVDTDLSYYVCPGELAVWMQANRSFFTNPPHPTLIPRGLLLDGSPGCLSGDSVLHYKRGKRNSGRPIRLASLYRRFNGLPDGKNPPRIKGAPTYTHSMEKDGSLRYNRIISIIKSGEKECLRITTESGRSLTLTPDHPVCLASGDFVPAGSLAVGSQLRMKGSMLPNNLGGKKKRVVHRREAFVKHHPYGNNKVVEGITYRRLHFARVMVEARMNNLSLFSYQRRLNNGNLTGLKFLSPDQEVHHLDHNPRNDRLDNLMVMHKADHSRLHGAYENFNVEYVVDESVVSVELAGVTMTYDVQMDTPCHNFVAEGFIVHNTCRSLVSNPMA